jgi:hypothetical protein
MRSARSAAVLTWVYAAGFGLPAIPVSIYLLQRGRLPTFWGLFEMYGGPWSAQLLDQSLVLRLNAFLLVTVVAAWVGLAHLERTADRRDAQPRAPVSG